MRHQMPQRRTLVRDPPPDGIQCAPDGIPYVTDYPASQISPQGKHPVLNPVKLTYRPVKHVNSVRPHVMNEAVSPPYYAGNDDTYQVIEVSKCLDAQVDYASVEPAFCVEHVKPGVADESEYGVEEAEDA